MKLCRYGLPRQEKPGLVDAAGALRDLSGYVKDIEAAILDAEGLAALRTIDPRMLPRIDSQLRPGAPYAATAKRTAIGLNHAMPSSLSRFMTRDAGVAS